MIITWHEPNKKFKDFVPFPPPKRLLEFYEKKESLEVKAIPHIHFGKALMSNGK